MASSSQLKIVQLFPQLLGAYGDVGNLEVLAARAGRRGLAVELIQVGPGDQVPAGADLYLLAGGEDPGQEVVAGQLRESSGFTKAVGAGATVLAVCAGMQVLGHSFQLADGRDQAGVGLLDLVTKRRQTRAIGELLTEPAVQWGLPYLTGFENHQGGSQLGPAAQPLAKVVSGIGNGADGLAGDRFEGVVQGSIFGTYLHGPVLARNPALADLLLAQATGLDLEPLEVPWVDQLRSERLAYVKSGRLS